MYSSSVASDPAAAVAALARADLPSADADTAVALVEQAQFLSGFALAAEAQALQRLAAAYPYPATVTTREDRRRAVASEIAAAFGCSQPAACARVVRSERLVELPDLLDGLTTGRVDAPRALMTIDKLAVLDTAADRRAAAAVVLAAHAAADNGLTLRQWSVLLGRAITAVDPTAADKRQAQTRRDRGVRLHPPAAAGDEAALIIHGPGEHAAAAHAAIDTLARTWRDTGHEATLDQLRHDAAIALLTGTEPHTEPEPDEDEAAEPDDGTGHHDAAPDDEADADSGSDDTDAVPDDTDAVPDSGDAACAPPRPTLTVVVNLTMGLSTLLGADDTPAELAGSGPIPAAVARNLAAHAETWRRILTDPVDAHVVTQQIRSYRPTPAMRQLILARHSGICAHRGCGRRTGLQLDHRNPWPHGPTTVLNLTPFDQTHHEDKTSRGWTYQLNPHTGAITQTTPAGRTYTTTPLPPPGATTQAQPPPTCPRCGSRICPHCGSLECLPDELRRGHGCPACASPDYLASPPPDWTDLDHIHLQRYLHEHRQTTDYDLIAKINTEQLADLNAEQARDDPPDDPDA